MTIKQKIYKIIGNQLGVEPQNLKSEMLIKSDLNIDPLDLVDLISVLEEQFKIEISAGEAKKFETIGNIETYVLEKVNEI